MVKIPLRYLGLNLMTEYPVSPIVMPSDLAGQMNGLVAPKLLRNIDTPTQGKMHHKAATAFRCLALAAYFDGVSLDQVGAYRTLNQQLTMFKQRYSLTPQGRNITRKMNGQTYYLRDGFAPSSTPGLSNHGWGLAVDIAHCSGDRLTWLLANAGKFGFTWETNGPQAEAWHIRYVAGDAATRGIRNALKVFPELGA